MEKKYKSNFGAKKDITAAQYITELMCAKMAEQRGDNLPDRFWNNKGYYADKFRREMPAAVGLLRIYDAKAIILALNDDRSMYTKSLRNKHLHALINDKQREIEYKKLMQEKKKIDEDVGINLDTHTRPRKQIGKPSRISKLRDE